MSQVWTREVSTKAKVGGAGTRLREWERRRKNVKEKGTEKIQGQRERALTGLKKKGKVVEVKEKTGKGAIRRQDKGGEEWIEEGKGNGEGAEGSQGEEEGRKRKSKSGSIQSFSFEE